MTQIGHFTRLRGLFSGRIRTLSIDAHLVFAPTNFSGMAQAPHYSIRLNDAEGPEVGSGWKRTGERAGEYVAVQLDDPGLPGPIRARLFQQDEDKKIWVLVWTREGKRDDVMRTTTAAGE